MPGLHSHVMQRVFNVMDGVLLAELFNRELALLVELDEQRYGLPRGVQSRRDG